MIVLLDFCRVAIRAGSSRGLAYQQWRRYHDTSWEEFCTFWASARTLEARKKEVA